MAPETHEPFMRLALEEAAIAAREGEVPIGAVLVREGEVIARDHNRREQRADPTAHAEILVLRAGGGAIGYWRLLDTDLYVTLEPCAMCAGAMVLSRIRTCIYGARDPKAGAAGSLWNIPRDPRLNHRIEVVPGVMETDCGEILKAFFRTRR